MGRARRGRDRVRAHRHLRERARAGRCFAPSSCGHADGRRRGARERARSSAAARLSLAGDRVRGGRAGARPASPSRRRHPRLARPLGRLRDPAPPAPGVLPLEPGGGATLDRPALLALPSMQRGARCRAPASSKVALGVATAFTAVTYAWVLIPESAKLVPASVDPKGGHRQRALRLARRPGGDREQRQLAATPSDPDGKDVVIVDPHWTICAQLRAAPGREGRLRHAGPRRLRHVAPALRSGAPRTPCSSSPTRDSRATAPELPPPGTFAVEGPHHARRPEAPTFFELYLYARRGQSRAMT